MTHFKELLEAKATIIPNKGVTGSLCKELTQKESDTILKALMDHERAEYELMDFIDDVSDKSVKYSDNLPISFGTRAFYLYAANGRLRIGTGGSYLTSCKDLVRDGIDINQLAKALKNADIR